MATKKRRNKRYRGEGSAVTPPTIRISAPDRSRLGQFWHDRKKLLLMLGVRILIFGLIFWLIFWLVF